MALTALGPTLGYHIFSDRFGRTPPSWAVKRGHINAVKLILKKYECNSIVIRKEDLDIGTP
jgi:hypothetical protein